MLYNFNSFYIFSIHSKNYLTNLKILYLILLSIIINLQIFLRFLKSKYKPFKIK